MARYLPFLILFLGIYFQIFKSNKALSNSASLIPTITIVNDYFDSEQTPISGGTMTGEWQVGESFVTSPDGDVSLNSKKGGFLKGKKPTAHHSKLRGQPGQTIYTTVEFNPETNQITYNLVSFTDKFYHTMKPFFFPANTTPLYHRTAFIEINANTTSAIEKGAHIVLSDPVCINNNGEAADCSANSGKHAVGSGLEDGTMNLKIGYTATVKRTPIINNALARITQVINHHFE